MDKSLQGRVQRMPLRQSAIRCLALGCQQLLVTNNFGYGWRAAPLLHVADEERGDPHFLKHCHPPRRRLVVAPGSEHQHPPRRQLVIVPASKHNPRPDANLPSCQQASIAVHSAADLLPRQQAATIVRPTANTIVASESKGRPTIPRHRRPPCHRRFCMSKQGTSNNAKAPSSALTPTCVTPTSEHHPPPHRRPRCQLSQQMRDGRQSRGTVTRPVADSLLHQQASIVIRPTTNLLSRQQARDGQ